MLAWAAGVIQDSRETVEDGAVGSTAAELKDGAQGGSTEHPLLIRVTSGASQLALSIHSRREPLSPCFTAGAVS